MPLEYQLANVLPIDSLVQCLSYSPDGEFLAFASVTGNIFVISGSSQEPRFRVQAHNPVLTLKWVKEPSGNHLWCGLANGLLLCIAVRPGSIAVAAFMMLPVGISGLALDPSRALFAVGGQSALKIWRIISLHDLSKSALTLHPTVLHPPAPSEEVQLRLLDWLNTGKYEGCLLISFANHGMICWDPESSSPRWSVNFETPIVSPLNDMVVVANTVDGLDIYSLPPGSHLRSIKYAASTSSRDRLPARFMHEGLAIMASTALGTVNLWLIDSGCALHRLQCNGKLVTEFNVSASGYHRNCSTIIYTC
ncbi:hypothetical protein HGRIS_014841 [Hohenbuehelia grisea]|uniref:Anaphase-promoting complex subunit 4-like WD40 domain-containing protein n=1 Tax=Hohenbuehelia grisea TaxID=104357 RepID=A0ABR3IQY9_9AGAR